MITFELQLCGPLGDGLRQEVDRALALVQLDNELVIQAMLRAGHHVPDTVEQLGIPYEPPTRAQAQGPKQTYRWYGAMLEHGSFSCGDAAAWEAAVLTVKYGTPARAFALDVVPDWMRRRYGAAAEGLFHSVYQTQAGITDPIRRYLQATGRPGYVWEALT